MTGGGNDDMIITSATAAAAANSSSAILASTSFYVDGIGANGQTHPIIYWIDIVNSVASSTCDAAAAAMQRCIYLRIRCEYCMNPSKKTTYVGTYLLDRLFENATHWQRVMSTGKWRLLSETPEKNASVAEIRGAVYNTSGGFDALLGKLAFDIRTNNFNLEELMPDMYMMITFSLLSNNHSNLCLMSFPLTATEIVFPVPC